MPTAKEMYDELQQLDPEGAVAVARAFIDELGDLPESIWHTLGMLQRDPVAMWDRLIELRAQHFEAQGQTAPPYQGGWE